MTVELLWAALVPSPLVATSAAVTQQLVLQQSGLEKVADVAIIFIALSILVVLAFVLVTINELRLAKRKLVAFLEGLRVDLAPTIANINEASGNVSFVTATLANRVADIDDTLHSANRKLKKSVNHLYGRAREFDALLRVAQGELEDVFISAASLMGGLKRGAGAAVGLGARKRRANGRVAREDDYDDRFDYESQLDEDVDEDVDGDDPEIEALLGEEPEDESDDDWEDDEGDEHDTRSRPSIQRRSRRGPGHR